MKGCHNAVRPTWDGLDPSALEGWPVVYPFGAQPIRNLNILCHPSPLGAHSILDPTNADQTRHRIE